MVTNRDTYPPEDQQKAKEQLCYYNTLLQNNQALLQYLFADKDYRVSCDVDYFALRKF